MSKDRPRGAQRDSLSVPMAAVTKCHRLAGEWGFNNRNALSHGSGAQKSKTKAWAGMVASEAVRENLLPASLLGMQLAIFSLCLHTIFSVCMSVSKFPPPPFFKRTPVVLD